MDGEYDEGYEMQERNHNQDEEEEDQFNTPDRFEDAEDNLDDEQQKETERSERRRSIWEPPTEEQDFSKIPDEQKSNIFLKTAGLEITKDLNPELFERTEFIRRKNSMTIQRIEYNGEKIYFIERGELKAYARETGRQSRARREFDEKLGAVRDAINDDIFRNQLEVDRRLNIADLDEADKFLMDANDSFYRERDEDKVREKLEEVEQKIQELQEQEEEQALLEKYKNISDNIRVNLLKERPKYMSLKTRNNILMNLERLREWLRSRLPLIGAVIGVAAGVFSVVYGIVAWTKGAAVATAKATHSAGKTIAKFLAKLGPIAAAIGSFVISLLSYLSQGVLWLANNLWILLLALLGFLYNEYRRRK